MNFLEALAVNVHLQKIDLQEVQAPVFSLGLPARLASYKHEQTVGAGAKIHSHRAARQF